MPTRKQFKPRKKNESRSFETGIIFDGRETDVKVLYSYSPGSPDVPYLSNGDPGYPGTDEEGTIDGVYRLEGDTLEDLSGKLPEQMLWELEAEACQAARDEEQAAYDNAMEREAESKAEKDWDR